MSDFITFPAHSFLIVEERLKEQQAEGVRMPEGMALDELALRPSDRFRAAIPLGTWPLEPPQARLNENAAERAADKEGRATVPQYATRIVGDVTERWTKKGREREMEALSATLSAYAQEGWRLHSLQFVPVFGSFSRRARSCWRCTSTSSRRARAS